MISAFAAFWNLCIFRGSPADVPAENHVIAILVAIVGAAASIQLLKLGGENVWAFAALAISSPILIVVAIYISLRVRSFPNRFRKSLAAYLGTLAISEVLITLVAILTAENEVSSFLLMGLSLWRIAVLGFILKHSLEVSLLAGVLLAFAFKVLAALVVLSIVPNSIGTTT